MPAGLPAVCAMGSDAANVQLVESLAQELGLGVLVHRDVAANASTAKQRLHVAGELETAAQPAPGCAGVNIRGSPNAADPYAALFDCNHISTVFYCAGVEHDEHLTQMLADSINSATTVRTVVYVVPVEIEAAYAIREHETVRQLEYEAYCAAGWWTVVLARRADVPKVLLDLDKCCST